MKNILIIFGGPSSEYFVSCSVVAQIMNNVDRKKYLVHLIGITKEGKWYYTYSNSNQISNGIDWINDKRNTEVTFSLNNDGLIYLLNDSKKINSIKIDSAFIPIPGLYGEDGRIPALLDMSGIPYVGSNVSASSCSLDKSITRLFAEKIGLKQPKCVITTKYDYENNKKDIFEKVNELGYPLFVKPANTGSSIGITKVISKTKLEQAIELSFEYCNKILIEEGITGTEIKVALYGNNDNLIAGSVCELFANNDGENFNDYATKYSTSEEMSSKKDIPCKRDEKTVNEIIDQAKKIYNFLGCEDYARVDFFLSDKNEIIFNEINTNPGFKDVSIYSVMLKNIGYSYFQLVNGLIEMSLTKKVGVIYEKD